MSRNKDIVMILQMDDCLFLEGIQFKWKLQRQPQDGRNYMDKVPTCETTSKQIYSNIIGPQSGKLIANYFAEKRHEKLWLLIGCKKCFSQWPAATETDSETVDGN